MEAGRAAAVVGGEGWEAGGAVEARCADAVVDDGLAEDAGEAERADAGEFLGAALTALGAVLARALRAQVDDGLAVGARVAGQALALEAGRVGVLGDANA